MVTDAGLGAALRALSSTPHLLVALDFDGTLAPLVERAEDARALPASAAALRALAALPDTTTALISGRALDSLRIVAEPPAETMLIGSHGAETWTGPDGAPLALTPEQQELLRRAVDVVERTAAGHQGTLVEYKPAGVVLHTRTAADDVADAAVGAARTGLAELGELSITDGKRVLEISVVRADKGQGLALLREATGATAVLFAGDDVTDEDAQRTLGPGDVGVRIGPGPTAASFTVDSPEDFTAVLEELVALRTADASSRGTCHTTEA
ncbi:trehalose-phosphatase [Arthrobacter sp. MDT1-48-3]|uniref:Trehalose 6-phosphate phosphatase n=1 Tax=Arthrobacter agilis TaxID=37921 RepID=A0A2L0UBK3_9MICC|nr:trehalose-phosphatase [Arthrobacter agilis]AUZ86616.1 trehalose-phosphatase [Arthrobacter agilis]